MTRVSGIRPAQTTSTSCSNASGPPSCAFAGRSAICRRRGDGVGPGVGERAGRPRRRPRRPRPGTLAAQGTDRAGGAAPVQRRQTRSGGLRGPDPERVLRLPSTLDTHRRRSCNGSPREASMVDLNRLHERLETLSTCSRRSCRRCAAGTARPDGRRVGQGDQLPQLTVASDLGPSRGGQGRGWTGRPPEGSHDGVRQLRMLRCHLGLEGARRRHRSRGGARCVPRRRLRPAHRWP